ncbi:MAG TPA: ABC transporter permease [Actinomycetota bacterium]|nr:ABC transporter permease [Actinomycetota bacterium]
MPDVLDATLLNSTFRMIAPILLAALGGLLCERVGVFNIALEGLMLAGAFAAVAGSFFSENAIVGVLTAVAAAAVLAALFGAAATFLQGNMIVLGIATNFLALGATSFTMPLLFGVKGNFSDPRIHGLGKIAIPGIDGVPVLGPMLSGHSWLVYVSWALVVAAQVLLFRHPLGLRARGIGERPDAAETLGVRVRPFQFWVVVLSGALCGLAGAQLSLGQVTLFVENMTAGRGWIAVVAVMFGRAHPLGVFGASVLFGFFDALGFRLQGSRLPNQFAQMIPYVATLVGLFVFEAQRRTRARRLRAPTGP